MTRRGYSQNPGEQFGVSTFRTEQSTSGLPNGTDREKQQTLPAGSATPKSVVDSDSAPANRVLPQGAYSGPASGSGTPGKSRTTPSQGGAVETKFDYGMPTRRTMTAESESDVDAAYKPRRPGYRRHVQTPTERNKRKREYRRNKVRERNTARRRYKTYKNNPTYKRKREMYRKNPKRHRMLRTPRQKTGSWQPIPFLYGSDQELGWIVALSEDGGVTVALEDDRELSVSPTVVLRTFDFLSEEEAALVDALLCEDDATLEDVAQAAYIHGMAVSEDIDPDDALCMIEQMLDGPPSRVAGDIMLYDQKPPSSLDNVDDSDNRHEAPEKANRPYAEVGSGQWTLTRKDQTHQPSQGIVAPNESLYGGGSGKVIPDHLKHASAEGQVSSYVAIKTFINVHNPLFHACNQRQFGRALKYGLRADGLYVELEGVRGLPFTRNLDLLMGNPYNRPYILIFDFQTLERRYRFEDVESVDFAGGFLKVMPSGIIPLKYIRGFIIGNRMFSLESRLFPRPSSLPIPKRRALVSPDYGV